MCVCDACCGLIIPMGACLDLSCAIINVLRCFFGFKTSDSVSQILLELGLPSFNTLLHNSRIIFWRTWIKCPNLLVSDICELQLCF